MTDTSMKQSTWELLKDEFRKGPEMLFLVTLGLYLLNFLTDYIAYGSLPVSTADTVQQWMLYASILLLGIYIGSVLVSWAFKVWPGKSLVVFPIIAGIAAVLYFCCTLQRNNFDGVMIAFLTLCACGRDYRKILKLYFWCTAAVVAFAGIGIPLGLTVLATKDGAYGSGFAFGFVHPNVWGYYVFSLLILGWSLFVSRKSQPVKIGYFIFSWVLAAFMVFVPKCRTQAVMLALSPFVALLCEKLVGSGSRTQEKAGTTKNILRWLLILTPVLCFALTVILGMNREWLVAHTFGTYVENFSKRFIQSGLALKEHGFPLFGEVIRFETAQAENLAGHLIPLYVMDNAYSTYTIFRGLIWMVPALIWLCYANRRMVIRKDGTLLAVSVMLCLVGLMERYPLEIYNFVFLYPLAAMTLEE